MLRFTDRLHQLCQYCDYSLANAEEWSKVIEAEVVYEESSKDADPTFPPDFSWKSFCALWMPQPEEPKLPFWPHWTPEDDEEPQVVLFPPTAEGNDSRVHLNDVPPTAFPHRPSVSVLWLSDTTFLSLIQFRLYKTGWMNVLIPSVPTTDADDHVTAQEHAQPAIRFQPVEPA
jgi:hypothetical protein